MGPYVLRGKHGSQQLRLRAKPRERGEGHQGPGGQPARALQEDAGGCQRAARHEAAPGAAVSGERQAAEGDCAVPLLQNAEANAEKKSLDVDALQITHIQVNQAPKTRRRTYRAHGRIGPYQNCPCHIEMILEEEEDAVARPTGVAEAKKKKISKKKLRREQQAMADAAGFDGMD